MIIPKKRPIIPGHIIIDLLGQGAYGDVYLCKDMTGKQMAVKRLIADERGIPSLNEANIMTSIIHPYLTHVDKIITDDTNLYLFQEKALHDLGYRCRKKKHLPTQSLLRRWSYALIQAVACLHQRQIVHADIKATNILVYEKENIRLTDFSLSNRIWKEGAMLNYKCGTATHRPLEVWLEQEWDYSMDIWSLGCTLFEMAYGTYLFPNQEWDNEEDVSKAVIKSRFISCLQDFFELGPSGKQIIPYSTINIPRSKHIPFHLPKAFYDPKYYLFNTMLLSMLRVNPSERPTISDLLSHPYFQRLNPVSYRTIDIDEEVLTEAEEKKYLEHLRKHTTNPIIIGLSLSLIRKIRDLRFPSHNFEMQDEMMRVYGCYWIACKMVSRRPPNTLSSLIPAIFFLERVICEYLSYCIVI